MKSEKGKKKEGRDIEEEFERVRVRERERKGNEMWERERVKSRLCL